MNRPLLLTGLNNKGSALGTTWRFRGSISRVISTLLITVLISAHEPPSRVSGLREDLGVYLEFPVSGRCLGSDAGFRLARVARDRVRQYDLRPLNLNPVPQTRRPQTSLNF